MGYDMYLRDRQPNDHRDDFYFHLNVWGMSDARRLMDAAGMLCWPQYDSSQWNTLPPYDESDPDGEGGPGYRLARDTLLAAHNGECPGIPGHKLCSNDGWIVTPPEIRAALASLRTYPVAAPPEWWPDWIEYLRRAEVRGGFEVH